MSGLFVLKSTITVIFPSKKKPAVVAPSTQPPTGINTTAVSNGCWNHLQKFTSLGWCGKEANEVEVILLMAEILHQLVGCFSHYLQGFIHPRWCKISAINSSHLILVLQVFHVLFFILAMWKHHSGGGSREGAG